MPEIHVYEQALCCDTGVCGPDVDQALVTFTADFTKLKGVGADVARHNLANDPSAFAGNETVRAFLEVAGSEGLPLTLVDGVVAQTGTYPTLAQLLRYTRIGGVTQGVSVPQGVTQLGLTDKSGGCCGPAGCC
jgi:arsenite-transporting ATPase